MERGEKLEDLEKKTGKERNKRFKFNTVYIEALNTGAQAFARNSETVKKKLCWKNLKTVLTFTFVVIFIILIFALVIWAQKGK